jgi:hypothetical protein
LVPLPALTGLVVLLTRVAFTALLPALAGLLLLLVGVPPAALLLTALSGPILLVRPVLAAALLVLSHWWGSFPDTPRRKNNDVLPGKVPAWVEPARR